MVYTDKPAEAPPVLGRRARPVSHLRGCGGMIAPSTDQTAEHFELLFKGVPDGYLAVSWVDGKHFRTRCFAAATGLADAVAFANSKQDLHCYIRLCPIDRQLGTYKRGTAADSHYLTCLWMDIDTADGEHKTDKLLPTKAQARELLPKVLPHIPSLVIDSGGGLHVYYLLTEPLDLHAPDEGPAAIRMLARFKQACVTTFKTNAYHIDGGTFDLARVLRVAGTWNHKTAPPKPVTITDRPGHRYDHDDLLESLPALTSTPTDTKTPAATSTDTSPAVAAMQRITPHDGEQDGSNRLFAWTCRGVEHGLTDDAIVKAVREAAETYPLPVDYTDTQILDRAKDAHKKTRAKENLLSGEMPVVDLGGKVRLLPIEVARTPKRRTLRAEVEIDGVNTEMEVNASDTPGGVRGAWSSILEFAGFTGHNITPDDADVIKPNLAKLLTAKRLDAIGNQIASATPRESTAPTGPAMADVVRQFLIDDLGLAFAAGDPAAVWSEAQGRLLRRSDITNHVPSSMRSAIARCHDYPAPTPADPTKDIKQLAQVNRTAWCDILPTLPAEADAKALGPDSKAAELFRFNLMRLWTSPETWMKFEAQGGEGARVERMSLASRVRELRHKRSSPTWSRVLKGTSAYYRVEDDGQVWIGMRVDLLGQIRGHGITGVKTQGDLTKIMRRYGLADETGITDRYRDEATGKQDRLTVLSRELADLFINCIDPEDADGDESSVTSSGADAVTVVREGVSIDSKTGEVVDA